MNGQTMRFRSVLLFTFALVAAILRPIQPPDGSLARVWAAQSARIPANGLPQAGWTSYTNTNKVLDLAFDGHGDLWAATTGGVVRWDTARGTYSKYTTADGLADHFVASVAAAPDGGAPGGAVWFGTFDGLSHYTSGGEWATYTTLGGVDCTGGVALAVTPDGVLWFGTMTSVSRSAAPVSGGVTVSSAPDAWITYPVGSGPTAARSLSLAAAADGTVWFSRGTGGVMRFSSADAGGQATYTAADGLASNTVTAIAVAPDGGAPGGAVWFGTWEDGVSRYDGASWRTFTTADGLASNRVQAIVTAPDGGAPGGAIWFGTDAGVSRCTGCGTGDEAGQEWASYTIADGLPQDSVRALAVAPDGALWAGTWGGGIARFDGERWVSYTIAGGPAGNGIQSIAVAPDGGAPGGAVWFATWGSGVSRFDDLPDHAGAQWTTFRSGDGLASNYIYAIAIAPDGTVWAGTTGGASRLSPADETWASYTVADGLGSADVISIAVAPDGAVWLGTWGGGASRFGGHRWITYRTGDGLADNDVLSIVVAPDGAVWLGTWGGGVSRYDGSTAGARWTNYSTADGLASNHVRALAAAPDGTLWAATEGGVSFLLPGSGAWSTWTHKDGLAADKVHAVAAGADGTLWFGTVRGVSRFAGAAPGAHTDLVVEAGQRTLWATWTSADGLADDRVSSIAVGADGALWFGAWHGGVARYLAGD